jgi:type III pantothenate kinase
MNLIFDIGNSSTKIALYDGLKKVKSFRTRQFHCAELERVFSPLQKKIEKVIVSTVRDTPEFIIDLATLNIPFVHVLSYKSKLPFKNEYQTPETLGPDRIAAVAGAYLHFPGEKVLIIDAGSAITYDFLSGKLYKGGNISPGLSMRFKALHKFTRKLPLVSTTQKFHSPGRNTIEAITAGVIKGMVYEINEYIRTFEKRHTEIQVVITGGDGGYLKERLDYKVTYLPEIVIDGLNYILEYNAK